MQLVLEKDCKNLHFSVIIDNYAIYLNKRVQKC